MDASDGEVGPRGGDMRLTLPRMLVTTLWMLAGAFLAIQLHRFWIVNGFDFGPAAYVVGFVVGFAGAVVLTWAIIRVRVHVFFSYPTCRQGLCSGIECYAWPKGTIYGRVRGGYLYRCKCGEQYIRDGRKFMSVGPEGARMPYKKLIGFHKWADDV